MKIIKSQNNLPALNNPLTRRTIPQIMTMASNRFQLLSVQNNIQRALEELVMIVNME
jgi:hypothetical protein